MVVMNVEDKFMTIVIKMPTNHEQCCRITDYLGFDNVFHGGRITAVSIEDEISRVEKYEEKYGGLIEESGVLEA